MKELWGSVRFNAKRKLWWVDGYWQGKRIGIFSIPTRSGFLSCKNKELAEYLQVEISKEIAEGTFKPERYKKSNPLVMAAAANEWLKLKKPNIKYKTWAGYKYQIDNYIIPLIGNEYLPHINHQKLQIFVNELIERELEVKTRKNIYSLLYQILSDHFKSGFIPQMPAGIKFSEEVKTIEWLTMDQQLSILEAIPERHRYIFRFIFATGVRPGEARALRKKDVHEDRIDIKKTFSEVKGGQDLSIVKNKREQAIPMYAEVRALLDEVPPNLTHFVFINPDTSKPYTRFMNRTWWNPACEKVLGYRFPLKNAGRHSLAHQILAGGGSMEDVQNALRHSNASVTRRFYGRPCLPVVGAHVDQIRKVK